MLEKRDVIIIGAGMGGLACGALLAKAGKKVTVLEQSRSIGGRATSFPLKGVQTEYGFHGLARGGHVVNVLEKIGHSVPMTKLEPSFVIYHDHKFFEVPGKIQDFSKFEYIPKSERAELVDVLRQISDITMEESEEYDMVSWADWLKAHTCSRPVYDFLALFGNIPVTEEYASNIAAGESLRCVKQTLKEEGCFIFPKDAPLNTINESFAEAIKESGGEVHTNVTVRAITVKDNTVRGITAEMGDVVLRLEAPVVIGNFPIWDIFTLVSRDNFPRWFVDRVNSIEERSQYATRACAGITCVSSQPLHHYKTPIVLPSTDDANRTGPSGMRWLGVNSNWAKIAPEGMHIFQYGPIWPPAYVHLLRERQSILEHDVRGLWDEIYTMFPNFKTAPIIWQGSGVIFSHDASMKFPGNAWKQRIDVKAPDIDGLYFVGDSVRGWGTGMDGVVCSSILCAERILKQKLVDTNVL